MSFSYSSGERLVDSVEENSVNSEISGVVESFSILWYDSKRPHLGSSKMLKVSQPYNQVHIVLCLKLWLQ